ncbi:hypothetical protein [Streptosporangium sp. NPDC049644]|uniref:hypothetical protein n=1 Tax=Streptosporangium sp. NPDC049644 TaxID=3155507 RepID=UPI003435D581
MASEQSSQSHLPPAWPEAAEPSPSWTNDPLGTGPRLPRPQEEPQSGNGSWQTSPGGGQRVSDPQAGSPGQTSPGGGWSQASDPQNNGWAQASAPQNDGWAQALAPQNDGWAQASDPQNNGWAQATSPQNDSWAQASDPQNNGWAQASAPQNDSWAQTSPGDGWAQATSPQNDSWAQAFSPRNDNWAQASSPQGGADDPRQTSPGNGWPQPTPSQGDGWSQTSGPQGGADGQNPSSPGNGWPQSGPVPQSDPLGQASPGGNGWAQATAPSHDGWAQASNPQNDGRTHPSGPQGDARGQQAPGGGEAWQGALPRDASGRPPAQPVENSVWPPTPPASGATWPPAPPTGNQGFAEAQTSTFPSSWAGSPADSPAAHFGDASAGTVPGASPDGGGGNGAGNARRSYGVPDNPAMWAMAAANAAAASQAPSQGAPVHPGAGGPQPPQPQPGQPAHPGQPGHHLSRDPSDPNRPFVTAGQISGPKTPPPERQQELWNTVFGDNYQAIEDADEFEEQGRPVWIFALAGSVIIALVGAVLWAFLAGPLASAEEEIAEPKPSATPQKTAKPATIGRLPRFSGDPSPVVGTLTDQPAGITLAQLGAPWRQDQRPSVPTTYGFTTRQYLPAGTDSTGKTQFAQLMSGPLSPRLKSRYTSPENLAPVINAVASTGRKRFFPEDNTARKTAQQTLSVNGLPGQLAAYEITSGGSKTTMVVAAVSTGADLPAIVYMSVPDSKKELLPDINTVFKSIRVPGR